MLLVWTPAFFEKDEAKKIELRAGALERSKEKFLPIFNSVVDKNGGHTVGTSLTWSDIYLAHFLDNIQRVHKQDFNLNSDYPALQGLIDMVFSTPGIKEFIDNRKV